VTIATRSCATHDLRAMHAGRSRRDRSWVDQVRLAVRAVKVSMAFGLAVVGLAVVGPALLGTTEASAASSCGGPVAGSARVVIVVDDGLGPVSIECLLVSQGTTGSQLLRQRAAKLGTAVPGHAGSGLLCTIDSFPASGCAETAGGSYWANFSATGGSWDYSSYNPFIRRVCDGDVEGWRYVVRGSGAAGDATPRIAPDALRPEGARGCGDGSISEPSGEPAGIPGNSSTAGAEPQDRSSVQSSGATGSDPSVVIDDRPGASTGSADSDPADPSSAGALAAGEGPAVDAKQRVSASQSASTSWIGLFAGVVLIGSLGLAALLRSRRSA
jgi:hypothetical protein